MLTSRLITWGIRAVGRPHVGVLHKAAVALAFLIAPATATPQEGGDELYALVQSCRDDRRPCTAERLRALLEAGANPNFQLGGWSVLHAAVAWGLDADALEVLVTAGANVNAARDLDTPLSLWAGNQRNYWCGDVFELTTLESQLTTSESKLRAMKARLDVLVDGGARLNDSTVLINIAQQNGCATSAHWLIDAGADVALKDGSGKTALDYSEEYLRNRQADPPNDQYAIIDQYSFIGYNLAVANAKALIRILRAGGQEGGDELFALVQSCRDDRWPCTAERLRALLEAGANPNFQLGGWSVLHAAVAWGLDADALEVLVTAGANVNAADSFGRTPLSLWAETHRHYWCWGDELELTTLESQLTTSESELRAIKARLDVLVDGGARLNDSTVLITIAQENSCAPFAQWLIDAGADVALKDGSGKTALDYSEEYLRNRQADPRVDPNNQWTISSYNLSVGNAKALIRILRRAGGQEGGDELFALVQSCRDDRRPCTAERLRALLEAGANPNFQLGGWSVLHAAVAWALDADALEVLVSTGANVNAADSFGRTPLSLWAEAHRHYWCGGDESELTTLESHFIPSESELRAIKARLDVLVDGGARLNDSTVLITIAQENSCAPFAQWLIDAGADVALKDGSGETALHYSEEYLRNRQADPRIDPNHQWTISSYNLSVGNAKALIRILRAGGSRPMAGGGAIVATLADVVQPGQPGEFGHGTQVHGCYDEKLKLLDLRLRTEAFTQPCAFTRDLVHAGIDLPAAVGTLVHPIAGGQVYRVIDEVSHQLYERLGYAVVLRHSGVDPVGDLYSLYLHLAEPPEVKLGDFVAAGTTVLGVAGTTGMTSGGPHVHLEVRRFPDFLFHDWGNIYGAQTDLPGRPATFNQLDFESNWVEPEIFTTNADHVEPNEAIPDEPTVERSSAERLRARLLGRVRLWNQGDFETVYSDFLSFSQIRTCTFPEFTEWAVSVHRALQGVHVSVENISADVRDGVGRTLYVTRIGDVVLHRTTPWNPDYWLFEDGEWRDIDESGNESVSVAWPGSGSPCFNWDDFEQAELGFR